MSLQAQQIVSQALQIAKCPGFTSQGGQMLNVILSELCQTYDLEVARGMAQVTVSPSLGSGPYALPADYLRAEKDTGFYYVYGVPYVMTSIDLTEFDALVQQGGISNYPERFATDTSPIGSGLPANMYVWPPSGGTYVVNIRYYRQMSDITTPETSTTVPWFNNVNYLITRLAGEMMKLADDERWQAFLGDGPTGAQGILDRYLKLQNDDEGRAKTVELDRRRFGRSFNRLKDTKTLGW
jgi:hypothetical protein